MLQVIEMTHDEKVKMYSKLSKKEIIEMLLENQRLLSNMQPVVIYPQQVEPYIHPFQPFFPLSPTCDNPEWLVRPENQPVYYTTSNT